MTLLNKVYLSPVESFAKVTHNTDINTSPPRNPSRPLGERPSNSRQAHRGGEDRITIKVIYNL